MRHFRVVVQLDDMGGGKDFQGQEKERKATLVGEKKQIEFQLSDPMCKEMFRIAVHDGKEYPAFGAEEVKDTLQAVGIALSKTLYKLVREHLRGQYPEERYDPMAPAFKPEADKGLTDTPLPE